MPQGKIKWYDETKGFGFIDTGEGKDIFLHRSGLKNNYDVPQEGDQVEFDTKEGDRGLIAINVIIVN